MSLIHFQRSGHGGQPLVLVHGFAGALADWAAQVEFFSPRHDCVAVDLRGHGASPGEAAECSIERYGADVAEVVRALGLPPVVLVGHSLGCRVVLETAVQAPEHVRGVVLVDGGQLGPGAMQAMRDIIASGAFRATVKRMYEQCFTDKSDKALAAAMTARAALVSDAVGQKMRLDMIRYDVGRLEGTFAQLRAPLLAIQSTQIKEKGERLSLSKGQRTPFLDLVSARVPDARIEIVPDTGHYTQIDAASETNGLIEQFLKQLEQPKTDASG